MCEASLVVLLCFCPIVPLRLLQCAFSSVSIYLVFLYLKIVHSQVLQCVFSVSFHSYAFVFFQLKSKYAFLTLFFSLQFPLSSVQVVSSLRSYNMFHFRLVFVQVESFIFRSDISIFKLSCRKEKYFIQVKNCVENYNHFHQK